MGRIHNPATGEAIEVDCSDPEATRRAMDRLVETPEPLEADKQSAEESRQAAEAEAALAGERERAAVARADAAVTDRHYGAIPGSA